MLLTKQINQERCHTLKNGIEDGDYTTDEELEELMKQLAACESWRHPFQGDYDDTEQAY